MTRNGVCTPLSGDGEAVLTNADTHAIDSTIARANGPFECSSGAAIAHAVVVDGHTHDSVKLESSCSIAALIKLLAKVSFAGFV
jgi:hypothetical protein